MRIWELGKPVIAQVHGYCLAGGSELATCCDLVYMADDAQMGYPAVRFGVPDNHFHAWFVGMRKAMEMMLTGDSINGKEAVELGWANGSVPADELEAKVLDVANRIAAMPQDILQLNKRVVHRQMEIMGLHTGIRAGSELCALGTHQKTLHDFMAQTQKKGLTGALQQRDEKFGDYRTGEKQPGSRPAAGRGYTMKITMVKKRLANGDPCPKCVQTEEMLRKRGHWEKIDEVVWAIEGEPGAPGWALAIKHDIEVAPFFVIEEDGEEIAMTSPMRLMKKYFDAPKTKAGPAAELSVTQVDVDAWNAELAGADPAHIVAFALERFGGTCAIAFSGGVDVVLLELAARSGQPFKAFTLDTGRLPEETYAYLDEVRRRFGVEVEVFMPDAAEVMELMSRRGANSFLRDGHAGCCAVRQERPLARALEGRAAWLTGRMADEEPTGGGGDDVAAFFSLEPAAGERSPVRVNPLARWTYSEALAWAREQDLPLNR